MLAKEGRETGLEPEVIRFACSYIVLSGLFSIQLVPVVLPVLARTGGWLSRGYHGGLESWHYCPFLPIAIIGGPRRRRSR
jgi:hypothetical protein